MNDLTSFSCDTKRTSAIHHLFPVVFVTAASVTQLFRQMRQKPDESRNAIAQLIRQAWSAVELSVDADRRDDWIWPAIAQRFPETAWMANMSHHRQGMTHWGLINGEGIFPLLKNVADQPIWKFLVSD